MKIEGTNIITINKSGLTKEVILKWGTISAELNTTKRGISLSIFNGKLVKNGNTFLIIPKGAEVFDFEEEIKIQSPLCECGCGSDVQNELRDVQGGKPYRVCTNCLLKLTTASLSKKEFKALLENGHTTQQFLLHDDFYDEEGEAIQPKF